MTPLTTRIVCQVGRFIASRILLPDPTRPRVSRGAASFIQRSGPFPKAGYVRIAHGSHIAAGRAYLRVERYRRGPNCMQILRGHRDEMYFSLVRGCCMRFDGV